MRIHHETCTGCDASFTAFDGACVVARLKPDTPRGACRIPGFKNGQGCPVLRASASISLGHVDYSSARLTEKDRRVFSVLTSEFATPTDIASRAGLRTRIRASLATEICVRLARHGLVEFKDVGVKRLWRLRGA